MSEGAAAFLFAIAALGLWLGIMGVALWNIGKSQDEQTGGPQ